MIPLKLTIEGLFSYQEPQVIDFGALGNSGLFGIFGAVGSGKSSILEAILFALYNRTERLPSSNQNYNMMNLRSDRLWIDFEFEASGEIYRFTTEGKRNRKDFEKVLTFSRSAYRKYGKDWLPLENHTAEDILGLNQENFRRTIIIPQGKFQEFLQLGDKARTEMIKEIFALERFEMWGAYSELETQNKEKLDIMSGKLSSLETLSEQQWEEAKQVQQHMEQTLNKLQKEWTELEKSAEDWKERKRLHDQYHSENETLIRLRSNETAWKEKKARIERYERLVNVFAVPLDRLVKLESDLRDTVSSERISSQNLEKAIGEMAAIKEKIAGLQISDKEADEELKVIEDLNLLGRLAGIRKELPESENHLARLKDKDELLARSMAPIQEKKKSLDLEKRSLLADIGSQTALAEWLSEMDKIHQLGEQWKARRKRLGEEWEKWKSEMHQLSWPGKTGEEKLEAYVPIVKEGLLHAETELERANMIILNASRSEQIALLQTQLENGSPCPVCGSIHHPGVTGEIHVNAQISSDHISRLKDKVRQWRDAENMLTTLLARQESLDQQKSEVEKELSDIAQDYQEKKKMCPANGEPPPEEKHAFQAYREILKAKAHRYEEVEKEWQLLIEKEGALLNETGQWKEKITEAERRFAELSASHKTLAGELKTLSGEESWLEGKDPVRLATELATKRGGREKELATMNTRLSECQTKIQGYSKEKELHSDRQVLLEKETLQLRDQLENLVQKHELDSLEQVKNSLAEKMDPTAERPGIEQFFSLLDQKQNLVQDLRTELEKRPFDPEKYSDFLSGLTTLKEKLEIAREQEVTGKARLNRLAEDLALKRSLLQEKETLLVRQEDLRTMRKLFVGSGFVRYISRVYLENICRAANVRFERLTRRQLSLQLNDQDDFEVVDQLNEGRRRSIRTLSGGQTFQASLCLALALAESVQSQARTRQNFFFLDEGFGSLDRDSLQVVFDTLKSLRKENRIVGIISHVEELQQEIQTYVRVQLDPEKGSRLIYSWE